MRIGAARALADIERWERNHPNARSVPDYLLSKIETVERYDRVETAFKEGARVTIDPFEMERIRDDLLSELPDRKERREAESALASRFRDVAASCYAPDLYELADSLDNCRRTGPVGIKPDGGYMIAWDHKCGQRRLCPDESREDTQRVAEFYLPAMLEWGRSNPMHRIYYAVFTDHNYRAGQLAVGKKHLFERFAKFREFRPHACPVTWEPDGYGGKRAVRSRRQYLDAPWDLRGALVIQEDPLSQHADWNVHLNVFLMVKGQFDYKTAREIWGANVAFYEIDTTQAGPMRNALLEAIKYSAQIVPSKSQAHAAAGTTAAPAMTEWVDTQLYEWWRAQQGFRRVRSYGELFALHGKRWDAMSLPQRVDLCLIAEVDPAHAAQPWAALEEATRVALREAMVHGERIDMSLIEWIGSVTYIDGAGYWVDLIRNAAPAKSVDLIPEHKSKGGEEINGTTRRPWGRDRWPPPDEPRRRHT